MMIKMVRVSLAIILILPAVWGVWRVMGQETPASVIPSPSPIVTTQEQGIAVGEPYPSPVMTSAPTTTPTPTPDPSPVISPLSVLIPSPTPTIKPSPSPSPRKVYYEREDDDD